MIQEIMQESNPELPDLSLFYLTPMHIIMKFHTKRDDYKTLLGEGQKKQVTYEGSKMRMGT